MKKLTKKDLINAVYENSALSNKPLSKLWTHSLKRLSTKLEQGNQVRV